MMTSKVDIQAQMGWLAECSDDGLKPILQNKYPDSVRSYFEHYGLDYLGVEHRFGWFESRGLKLAGHIWMPGNDGLKPILRGSVILLHGYMNHTGQMRHLIPALLEQGLAVGVFDMPGHGLSEGVEGAVEDFEHYTQAVRDFAVIVKPMCDGPMHLLGFSTGAGAAIDYLLQAKETDFAKVILAAPLIHWQGYEASKATYSFYRTFTDKIPRLPQRNSSDHAYLLFNRNSDYLHSRQVSLDWVKAVFNWNDKIGKMSQRSGKILILQGDRDTTVDWRYNIKWIRGKFPDAKIEMIHGARHELFNEAAKYREKVIDLAAGWIGGIDD